MLDVFFRRYAWIANAALLVAAAWLSARTVNTVIAASIRPRPQVDLSALPAGPGPVASQQPLDPDRLYALFGQKPPKKEEPTEAAAPPPPPPENCSDPYAIPVRSALRAQLVVAVLAEPPELSIATILDQTTRETRVVGVGDPVITAKLLGLQKLRDPNDLTGSGFRIVATICSGGQKEFIDFEGADGTSAPAFTPMPAPLPAAPAAPGGADLSGVKKLSENRYEIPKKVVSETLGNLNNVATQARIVPSFKNGVANGFKLFSIQPNSLYSSIGVENGDVIQRINGYEINSPDKALEIYQKLREAAHVTIDLERNGQTIRKDYNITGP